MFPRRYVRSLAVAVLAVAGGAAAVAQRPATAAPAAADTADVDLARGALAALDADPDLRHFNLVVSVVDRVAVVGGPVGSDALKARAAELVGRVPGVRTVRNGCFVQAGNEALLALVADRPTPRPALPPVGFPRRPIADAAPVVPAPLVPVEPVLVAATDPPPAGQKVVARRPANPGDNVLLPPVAVAAPVAGGFAPAVLTARPSLADAVEAARRADPRFAGLRAELRADGEVVISGGVRPTDAWDFADRLRGVPGVMRVVVGR